MRQRFVWMVAVVCALALLMAGCGGEEVSTAADGGQSTEAYVSEELDTAYEGALNVSSQLALGTLELEGTGDAVTAEQAAMLLPLWQALQGGVTAQVEVEAVLRQIEQNMNQTQLQAIAAMQLTQDDTVAWMEQNGIAMPAPGEGQGFGGMGFSEEERATIRATAEAGGGFPGRFGGGQGMSEEERAAARATMEASGAVPAGGFGGGRGRGGMNLLIGPLVDLLTERGAE